MKAGRNRTLTLDGDEIAVLQERLLCVDTAVPLDDVIGRTIHGSACDVLPHLPENSVDLLFADPPYNMQKSYNGRKFTPMPEKEYEQWLRDWIELLPRILTANGSVYVCCDWRSSGTVQRVLSDYFIVQNRITWEREKGRGAKRNWKNNAEDIWFCTMSSEYTFNVDAVKLKRQVIAPYTEKGRPKDWDDGEDGRFRLTHPSNLWTDLTVPFWSMPENTDHPTQKPEKLVAKAILASSNVGDVVLDPFLGSGTTSVVAKKLGRQFIGIEREKTYCCLAEKRLALAESNRAIQGYVDGVFWERNTLSKQKKRPKPKKSQLALKV